ncbi:TPA: hypothetical protein MAM40_004800 [Klebsiella pneumoniae]|nr:hypothetical protein [Klebsiella pneumoniae]
MTMFLMFSAPCAAVISKPTIRKVTNAMKKLLTKLRVISAVSKAQTLTALTTAARITPMTDITELALRLKLEAHRAVSNFNPQMNIKTRDLKELVEALEKAQETIAFQQGEIKALLSSLESRTVKLPAERFCPAEYAGSQLWSETEVWNKAITACADELRAAGIKVEAA